MTDPWALMTHPRALEVHTGAVEAFLRTKSHRGTPWSHWFIILDPLIVIIGSSRLSKQPSVLPSRPWRITLKPWRFKRGLEAQPKALQPERLFFVFWKFKLEHRRLTSEPWKLILNLWRLTLETLEAHTGLVVPQQSIESKELHGCARRDIMMYGDVTSEDECKWVQRHMIYSPETNTTLILTSLMNT